MRRCLPARRKETQPEAIRGERRAAEPALCWPPHLASGYLSPEPQLGWKPELREPADGWLRSFSFAPPEPNVTPLFAAAAQQAATLIGSYPDCRQRAGWPARLPQSTGTPLLWRETESGSIGEMLCCSYFFPRWAGTYL